MSDWGKSLVAIDKSVLDIELTERDVQNATRNYDYAINLPTGTIKWNPTNKRDELWNGSSWGMLATTYFINVSALNGQNASYYQKFISNKTLHIEKNICILKDLPVKDEFLLVNSNLFFIEGNNRSVNILIIA